MTTRLWIDVEDLFEYARANFRRPSGIQRVAFEVARELQQRLGDAGLVQFVRHSFARDEFLVVSWAEAVSIYERLLAPDNAKHESQESSTTFPKVSGGPVFMGMPGRQLARRVAYRLPPDMRLQLIEAMMSQARAMRLWVKLLSALTHGIVGMPRKLWRRWIRRSEYERRTAPVERFADLARPGDIMLAMSAAWSHFGYADLIERECKANGIRFALLVYDLIPVRRPEWCDANFVRAFRSWIDSILPLCDEVFTISRAAKKDLEAYVKEQEISLHGGIVTVPMGATLQPMERHRTRRLPPPGSYALIVSTIEARKNHLLLFRVWRRLLEEWPRERVPSLVFAGRVGWLVADLMQQISNTACLDGKLILIDNASDSELASLYDGCLFTLLPSFYEGWGLPVTESLGFGKPCIIANRTSLPEAGGKLVKLLDPDNLNDAYAVIRDTIEDRAGLANWEARVRREYVPVPWSATVDTLLAELEQLSPSRQPQDASA